MPSLPPSPPVFPIGKIDSPAEFGRRLRERRRQSNLTLVAAASLAGVSLRFLSELERGKKTASLGKALQVAGHFGLELWVMERGTGRFGT